MKINRYKYVLKGLDNSARGIAPGMKAKEYIVRARSLIREGFLFRTKSGSVLEEMIGTIPSEKNISPLTSISIGRFLFCIE